LDQSLAHARSVQPFAIWREGFTAEELDLITATGDALGHSKATIDGADDGYADIRITRTAWIGYDPKTQWLYERLMQIGGYLNNLVYRLDVTGISERLQYTIYDAGEGGHYDWHVDHGTVTPVPRKLSLVLQLSDPSSYEGCELQIHAGNKIETPPIERGTVILFPAYVLHRVTPITMGTRRSLVSWISGPLLR
jgi:PKHD-type hydroxylase